MELEAFRRQLDLLQQLGTIVPLHACDDVNAIADGRPQFVLTFDDDDARHSQHVLPELVRRGLPGTFFLSGRWLRGYGPYWWELLEQEIAAEGADVVAARHGLPSGTTGPQLGQALTGKPAALELAERAH